MDGIATRVAVFSSLVVLVATATVGFLVYNGAKDSLIQSASDRVAHTAETVKVGMWGTMSEIGDDVRFLAQTPPVEGIVRARMLRGLDPMWSIRDDEWGEQLAETFRVFLESRSSYLIARFVGVIGDGRELVRVERRNGQVVYSNPATFRTLADTSYVRNAAELPEGGLYLSHVVWGDSIDGIPQDVPIFTISTPVYTASGQIFGVVAVTVDFRDITGSMESLVDLNQTLYVARASGEMLHIYRSNGRSGALGPSPPSNLRGLFPETSPLVEGDRNSLRLLDVGVGNRARGIAYFEAIHINGTTESPRLLFGVSEPHETILAGVRRVRNTSALITLLLGLAAIGLALTMSRYITHPIRKISRAVSAFGTGGDLEALPVERQDEIGILARSFEAMQLKIQEQIKSIEDEEERQRTILETAAEGIIVLTGSGRIETFNPAAEAIFGRDAGEMIGRPIDEIIPEAELASGSIGGKTIHVRSVETTGLRSDEREVPLAVVWSSFRWGGEDRYTIIVQDISERREAEEAREHLVRELESERRSLRELSRTLELRVRERTAELERLNVELQASNRELREIASVASHDLQEPLRKLRSFADLLTEEYREVLDEDGRFYIQRIFCLAERMSHLLNDLLAFSSVASHATVTRRVDLEGLAHEVVDQMEPAILSTRAQVHVHDLPEIDADPRQLRVLLANLIENALAYRRADVPPTVDIYASYATDASGRRVCRLSVEDNGMGFDEKYVDRIFSPFERLHDHRAAERTGMGLTICRRIAENHMGSISAESTPGAGSTFTVTLPLENEAA